MFRADRLNQLLLDRDISQSELARRIGVSQTTVWKLTAEPVQATKHLHKIAVELATSPAYLMGETDDPKAGAIPIPTPETIAQQLDVVALQEIDLGFGMGATDLSVPVTSTVRHFSRAWIRQYTKNPPEKLYFAQGIGDSMMPTILDADLLLIDSADCHLDKSDKIWALAYGNSGMVKRLRPMPDGSVKILSDNQSVPVEIAYDGELHILGRVVAAVRKF